MSSQIARVLTLAPLALIACGDDVSSIEIPAVGTNYVLIVAAGGNRAAGPLDARVALATDIADLQVPGAGGVDVDMVFAGIDEAALPAGLSPLDIEFAPTTRAGTRPLPPLKNAHILRAQTPAGTAGVLIPIGDAEDLIERRDRLFRELAIKDPCGAPKDDFDVITPRSRAGAIDTVRVLSNGDTYFGLTVTSTALIGRLRARSNTFEEVPFSVGSEPVMRVETVRVMDLGDGEVQDPELGLRPDTLGFVRGDIIGNIAVWSSTAARYLDVTPRHLTYQPGASIRLRHVQRGGTEQLCGFGSIVGMDGLRLGAAWCRDGSRQWQTVATVQRALRFTEMFDTPQLGNILIDPRGVAHHEVAPNDWQMLAVPAVNQDVSCSVACVGLPNVAVAPPALSPSLAVIAGRDGHVYTLEGLGNGAEYRALDAVRDALFADESTGTGALDFSSVFISADGAIWLAAEDRAVFLLRVEPDRSSAKRVCLPRDADGSAVTAMAGDGNGRFVLGLTPVGIAVGTWHQP